MAVGTPAWVIFVLVPEMLLSKENILCAASIDRQKQVKDYEPGLNKLLRFQYNGVSGNHILFDVARLALLNCQLKTAASAPKTVLICPGKDTGQMFTANKTLPYFPSLAKSNPSHHKVSFYLFIWKSVSPLFAGKPRRLMSLLQDATQQLWKEMKAWRAK